MKTFGVASIVWVLASWTTAGRGVAQQVRTTPVAVAAQAEETPAEARIANAKRQLAANPKKVQAYNDLAIGYLKRARETAQPAVLDEAEAAVTHGLTLDANDFPLQKTQIALQLARHEYVAAQEGAATLNKRTPDDVMLYGYLAEADLALGHYGAAEKSAQWMLNLLPNNVPGLLLGAQLRVLYGDGDGALQMLNLASTVTSPTEVDDLAWIANEMAAIQIATGKSEAALGLLDRAEQLFPGYPYTLVHRAAAERELGHPEAAVTLLQSAIVMDSDADLLYKLAGAQRAAGRKADAEATEVRFVAAVKDPVRMDEASRDLVVLESGNPATAAKGLALAERQIAVRQDVGTLDAYAWALAANGRFAEAEAQEAKALAVGVQSAEVFNHAGHIALSLKKTGEAAKFFEQSLRVDPISVVAGDSRLALGMPGAAVRAGVPAPVVAPVAAAPAPVVPEAMVQLGREAVASFPPVPAALLTPKLTETARRIQAAQARVAREPKNPLAYTALGAQFFQQARETGDVSDYERAEQALAKSLDLDSTDFSAGAALQTMAEVCMGEHRFPEALQFAQRALSLGSGDVSPFAIVGDAYADMGEYAKAGEAYARLTPPERTLEARAAYARDSRLSYLRFIAGDSAGAIALMRRSIAEGTEAQLPAENLAWLHYELGEYLSQAGAIAAADAAYLEALAIHPGDYRALAALGKLRGNQGRYREARMLYERAIAVVPMPIFIAELGDLERKAGDAAEAKKQYALVEYIGLLGHINQVLHNRDLALFYADHDLKPADAVALARKEFELRHDVYTSDALAWALYKAGSYAEAAAASEAARRFGTRDALLLFHAGMIAEKQGRTDDAQKELAEALAINPHFHALYAGEAARELSALGRPAASNGDAVSRVQ